MKKAIRSPLFLALLLLLGQFTCARVNADVAVEAKALHLTLRAKSRSELAQIDENLADLKRDREFCRAQLQAERLPTRCFRVVRAEFTAGLLSAGQVQRETEWLERLCLRRVKEIKSFAEFEGLSDLDGLSQACRVQVEMRWGDLRYRQESENPAGLFAERFTEASDGVGPKVEVSDAERTKRGSRRLK
jgi:hypothetical protein